SRISAAAANRSRAASPILKLPPCSSAKTDELLVRSPAPAATPATVSPLFTNERRLIAVFMLLHMFSIGTASSAKEFELTKKSKCRQNVKRLSPLCLYTDVTRLAKFIGEDSPIDALNRFSLQRFAVGLYTSGLANRSRRRIQAYARDLIKWT